MVKLLSIFATLYAIVWPVFSIPLVQEPSADNAAKIVAAIHQASADLVKLNNTLNQIGSTVTGSQLVTLQNENTAILNAYNKIGSLASSSVPFTSSEAQAVITAVTSNAMDIRQVVDNLIRHKAAFESAGAGGSVRTNLQGILSAVEKVCQALENDTPAAQRSRLAQQCHLIQMYLQDGINAFS